MTIEPSLFYAISCSDEVSLLENYACGLAYLGLSYQVGRLMRHYFPGVSKEVQKIASSGIAAFATGAILQRTTLTNACNMAAKAVLLETANQWFDSWLNPSTSPATIAPVPSSRLRG
ncbi:MAG: hypothetical protein JSR58_05825 [Verrucomicrobia bacterium]|nr:hypothetical protein [Verrucomicrobiota bacterium]